MLQAAQVVNLFFEILTWLIIARILLSWIPHNPHGPVLRLLYEGTEPILAPFRRLLPKSSFPLDLSPLIALLVLRLVREAIITMLLR
ncbi:MAG: YggT family protein [Dethiobacter sp.]|nr:YggT family protein [Dethiobacter sp.]MCL5982733.1 YggT family protein [Bacillota bacterium]